MAQTDLVSQKILGTDPLVGFGESAVLPYRQRQFESSGYDAMERAQTRQEAAKAAREKNNEDYYNTTIKALPEYQREFERGLGGWRDEIVSESAQMVKNGVNPSQTPDLTKKVLQFTQAAKATTQINNDLEKINTMPIGKYTNRESVKGAALKKYTELVERVNNGDRSAFGESIIPNPNDPEHFLFDQYYNDKYGSRGDTVTGEDQISYGPKGERITGKKVTARFTTNKNGKVVPGIDRSIIEDDLYSETTDPNTLQFREAVFSLADKQITNKALELKQSGDPRYENMGTTQIASSISANPKDPHYKDFNRNKIAEDIDRQKVEAFQRISTDNSIGALNEYNKDGDGSKKQDFVFEPAVISQNSASGNVINIPGVVLAYKDKPLTINVAANSIYDFNTGKQDLKNTNRVPIKATSVGLALTSKGTNKIMAFKDVDATIDYINKTPLKELNNLKLDQYIFGNIEEKKDTEGDTGADDAYDKFQQTVNRSIAIKYNKEDETGAQINLLSGGKFNERPLTPDEQRLKDAWDKKTAKKPKSDRPLTVVQNGVTYNWNAKTETYE